MVKIKGQLYYFEISKLFLNAAFSVQNKKLVIQYKYADYQNIKIALCKNSLILEIDGRKRTIACGAALSARLAPLLLKLRATNNIAPVEYEFYDALDIDLKDVSDMPSDYPGLIDYAHTESFHSIAIQPLMVLSENFRTIKS